MTATTTTAPSSAPGYTLTARVLHWVTAVIVICMIPGGIYMANTGPDPTQDLIYHLHRSFGVVLLAIMLVRMAYRLRHPPPLLPRDIPLRQRRAAYAVHGALYALLIMQAIIGWIASSAYRAPILVFWLFELPPIWPQDRPFSEGMFVMHDVLGFVIAALALLHIAAALHHQFVRKDGVLMRMVRT